jgi:hypothetical protein
MREDRGTHGLPVFSLAVLGLVAGHGIAYLIAIPNAQRRAAVLQSTGHAYLPLLVEIGLILAVAGAASLVTHAFGSRGRLREDSLVRTAAGLGALQAGSFVVLEVVERLLTHMPLHELVGDHVLGIGVVVQLGVALIGTLVLRAMARTAARLALVAVPLPTPRPSGLFPIPLVRTLDRRPVLVGAVGVRGPPLP